MLCPGNSIRAHVGTQDFGNNDASVRLLGKIGLRFDGMVRLSEDAPEIKLFTSDA